MRDSHFMKDTLHGYVLNLKGNYFFSSDAITNGFASDYYFGKFLTEDLKNDVSGNLSAVNLFAGELNWEASLIFHPDTTNRKVEAFISYRNRSYASSRFSNDFFELFFRGNKMFAGKTADLGDFFFQQFKYHQFVFGIGNEFNIGPGQRLFVGADIAINQGIRFLKVIGKQSDLYTDPGAEFVDADLQLNIFTDDSAAQHPSKLDGTGYSGDFYLEYETEKNLLSFSVENAGSIHWNKWSTEVAIDTSFHFEGIDVRDLFDIGDSIQVNNGALDSSFYQNFVQNRTEHRIITKLPMKISGAYTVFLLEHKYSVTAGIDVLLNTYSSMRFFGEVKYMLNRSTKIGLVIASGGYTPLCGGLNITHQFPRNYKIGIGSNYVYPMISYKQGKSQGAYLSLSKSF